jgi:hypothetical protein
MIFIISWKLAILNPKKVLDFNLKKINTLWKIHPNTH